eukprot:8906735-Alexandrium_andersonii.AAC.1
MHAVAQFRPGEQRPEFARAEGRAWRAAAGIRSSRGSGRLPVIGHGRLRSRSSRRIAKGEGGRD